MAPTTLMRTVRSRPDAVNTAVLNLILWRDRKGSTPMPAPKHAVFPQKRLRDAD